MLPEFRIACITMKSLLSSAAPWKKIFDAVENTGGVEYYLIEQETGGPDGALAMVKHCLDNYKKIHGT